VYLQDHGVGPGDMVTIAVPNSIEWFVAYLAAWRLGAIPQPVSWRLPARELQAIVELANPSAVIGIDDSGTDAVPGLAGRCIVPRGFAAPQASPDRVPALRDEARVSPAWKAPTSGGSTGRPKLIVSGDPALIDDTLAPPLLLGTGGCLIMPGPLYHNGPGVWSCQALLHGNHVVLLDRFDPELTLASIERFAGTVLYVVPTMMKRIWRLPEQTRDRYDLSSLRVVWHLAEPCPEWLKQCWIDWLGADRIFELYAGTEAQTATIITGQEWLAHRGSVGRCQPGAVMITDENGVELPVGEMGEVWLRNPDGRTTYRYVGADARTRADGWESLGDMGYVDSDGYLYLGDRAADMILSGGANIYPAEVEAALQEHPLVESCAVIGLPDEDKGNVVHAIVQAVTGALDADELRRFLGERLVVYKLPRTFEFVDEALRDDAGKVRRSALRAARVGAPPAA
jgi:bile acid-coenzyme A ligase